MKIRGFSTICLTLVLLAGMSIHFTEGMGDNDNQSSRGSSTCVDWVSYYTTDTAMINDGDLIITGKVLESLPEQRADMIFTKQVVEIKEVMKADGKKIKNTDLNMNNMVGQTIEVLQTGGELNGIKTPPFEEAPLLEVGKTYFLLLQLTDEGHYLPLGGYQGVGEVKNNKIQFPDNTEHIFKNFNGKSIDDSIEFVERIKDVQTVDEETIDAVTTDAITTE